MKTIEHTLLTDTDSGNIFAHGFASLWAQFSVVNIGLTLAMIALSWGASYGFGRWLAGRHEPPLWLVALSKLWLPLSLWLLAHLAIFVVPHWGMSRTWYVFLARLFAAWFCVRLFLYVVRRALPDGTRRLTVERVVVVLVWVLMLIDYTGHLTTMLDALDEIHFRLGKSQNSLLDILTLVVTLSVLWLVIQWLAHEAEDWLLRKPNAKMRQFDLSTRMVFMRLVKALLLIAAILISLSAAEINLTVLSVFGGALGVGIGLGLQKIASNYVSGFMILLEKSVRIGDLITTADGTRGFVRTINARYTLIEGASGDETLIPNENLITNPVVNWTLHDKKNWLSTQIPINYDIDLDFILPKIAATVQALPRIAQTPPPAVLLSSISDKGYIIEITWWLIDPENGRMNIISAVNLAAWRVLREYDVDVFTLKSNPAPAHPTEKPEHD